MTAVAVKRRPRRIAADEAHAWARNLRLGNSLAKLVLSMCTIYVDGEGRCFPGIESLSEDTELSVDTVRKRLAWLEQIGAIARFPQWIDDAGRRNGEGRGKRTSDEIRLLMDADPDDIERRAKGNGDGDGTTDVHVSGPSPQQGLNPTHDSVSPRLAPDQPSDSGEGSDSSNLEPEERTPNPLSGGVEVDLLGESFKPFAEAYPAPITDMARSLTTWAALSETERIEAITGARGYRSFIEAERRRGGKRGVKDAHRWLRDKAWLGYLIVGKQFEAAESAPKPAFVSMDSREGKAALALYAIARSPPERAGESIRLKQPLTPQALALADAPPQQDWPLLDLPQQAGAWLEMMQPLIGRGPIVEDHIVGKRFVDGPDGRPMFAGNDLRKGFKAPWPWPPRKDGTVPTRADNELSDSDIDDFK